MTNEELKARVGELEVTALRAEVERLRDGHTDLVKTHGEHVEARFIAEHSLAAANALLDRLIRGPVEPMLKAEVRAHLSGQASARTDHERAVLKAIGKCSCWRDGTGRAHLNDTPELAEAELARREAEK